MGAIRAHEFMTVDGVADAPTWSVAYGFDPAMSEAVAALMTASDGILLGRTTYEMFAPAWSGRTAQDDPGAPFFNDTTKYVVSRTLTETSWQNTTVIGPYDPERIRELRASTNLYVSGSATLVRALLADHLLDELHLFVYPLVRGEGARLFAGDAASQGLVRTACEAYDNGVVHLAYAPE